jgi:hypothetical protein
MVKGHLGGFTLTPITMETIQSLDTMMDYLVDETAQHDPQLFRELHCDRQAVRHALEVVLRLVATHKIPAEPEEHPRLPDKDGYDLPTKASVTPDSCIWMP